MDIRVNRLQTQGTLPDVPELGFGKHFSDHIFLMDYSPEDGWHDARIEPYGSLGLEPANLTLHYGQSIFEGAKAFRWKDGSVHSFRLNDHVSRFARSAARMVMPGFDKDFVQHAIQTLIRLDSGFVPPQHGTALYLRPTLIASDNALGVRCSTNYLMFVITSPVGNYYAHGSAPTRILVEEYYSRVCAGGLGEAKTGANYAASLLAADVAKHRGFDQVLWLDARQHRYVEEVGTMNIFFVIDDVLVTPPLDGTILDGITRRSVLQLAHKWGLNVEERPISMDEVVESHGNGKLQEVFGSGTAAIISQVGELNYKGRPMHIHEPENSVRSRLYNAITAIQYGQAEDVFGWMQELLPAHAANSSSNGVHTASGTHTPATVTA